ncbi:hypothetical protein [Sodalis sp. RH16]|uniref:DUF7446 family protein n=1 Tax=Sodalis sp. RH16 TaxID=3394331 RepID=UPI0039B55DBD
MAKNIHIGLSPLTGTIFAGTAKPVKGNTNGAMQFTGEKVDVTSLALAAVAEKLVKEDRIISWTLADGRTLQLRADYVQKAEPTVIRRCPRCGSSLVATERRPDGNSTCDQGHVFPTASAIGGSHGKN